MTALVGCRLDLYDLTLVKRSFYEKEIDGKPKVIWRYQFRGPDGEQYVYSGRHLFFGNEKCVHLRATIKRHETQFNLTRLARPVIITKSTQGELL